MQRLRGVGAWPPRHVALTRFNRDVICLVCAICNLLNKGVGRLESLSLWKAVVREAEVVRIVLKLAQERGLSQCPSLSRPRFVKR